MTAGDAFLGAVTFDNASIRACAGEGSRQDGYFFR
jgi:hypothetical protein